MIAIKDYFKNVRHMNLLFFLLMFAGIAACGGEEGASEASAAASSADASAMAGMEVANSIDLSDFDPGKDIPLGLQPNFSDRVRIEVEVDGFNAGGRANLIGQVGENRYLADTAVIDPQGRFVFTNDQPYREGLFTIGLPNNTGFQVMLVENQMDFSMKTRNGRLIEEMEITNSLENELLYINLKFERKNRSSVDSLNRLINRLEEGTEEHEENTEARDRLIAERRAHIEFFNTHYPDALFTKFKVGGQNPVVRDIRQEDGSPDLRRQAYYFRNEFWDNVDFSDPRLINTPIIMNKLKRYMDELVPQNADSINKYASLLIDQVLDQPEYFQLFANWITINFDAKETTIMDPEAVYVHMIQNYFTAERAFWADEATIQGLQMRAREKENSLVGLKGPDVRAPGPDGSLNSLYEMDQDYIVVYMYNPTCSNCMIETPKLVDWLREWSSKGAGVFAIAIDTDNEEWVDYINKNNMHDFVNVFDPTNRAIYAKYYVNVTPEIYVLNPDRTIIGKNLKTFQIETIINRDKERRGAL
ncbi:MAG: DUF5106 domain-containing protein [Saprospirales bacterium]|nr:MAG: DUF5106 domain-containing protein [Saprospirales bacterium]